MIRLLAYLRSLLISQVYVVLDGGHCVGVSGRLQGAELLRADHARAIGQRDPDFWPAEMHMLGIRTFNQATAYFYDRQQVSCHELRDV